MKYARLTKEQFVELHQEFVNFLAAQSIDKAEWDKIKAEQPQLAEQVLDVFSDLIWEGVLTRAAYLEHFSSHHVFLFHCDALCARSIILKATDSDVNLLTQTGLQWLSANMFTDAVEIKIGSKDYTQERNTALFELIQQGAILSDGHFYQQIDRIVNE